MEAKKNVIVVIALVAILLSLFSMIRGCSCSSGPSSGPTVPEVDRYWVLASMGGWFSCPECGGKVTLTQEQQRLVKPPEMACPHCGKTVDFAKLGRPPAPPAGKETPSPGASGKMEDLYFPTAPAAK